MEIIKGDVILIKCYRDYVHGLYRDKVSCIAIVGENCTMMDSRDNSVSIECIWNSGGCRCFSRLSRYMGENKLLVRSKSVGNIKVVVRL